MRTVIFLCVVAAFGAFALVVKVAHEKYGSDGALAVAVSACLVIAWWMYAGMADFADLRAWRARRKLGRKTPETTR